MFPSEVSVAGLKASFTGPGRSGAARLAGVWTIVSCLGSRTSSPFSKTTAISCGACATTANLDALMREVEARGGPKQPVVRRSRATARDIWSGGSWFPQAPKRRVLSIDVSPPGSYPIGRRQARNPGRLLQHRPGISRARAINRALVDIAEYTRKHAALFAREGAASLSASEAKRRTAKIAALADELNGLASAALDGGALYTQFEAILGRLHRLGFFPNIELVSAGSRTIWFWFLLRRSPQRVPRAGSEVARHEQPSHDRPDDFGWPCRFRARAWVRSGFLRRFILAFLRDGT